MEGTRITTTGRILRDDDLVKRALDHGRPLPKRREGEKPLVLNIDYAALERRVLAHYLKR